MQRRSIPEDIIITHILIHVKEVKALTRLSCVCKLWRHLITSNGDFMKSHLRHQPPRNVLFLGNNCDMFETHNRRRGRYRKSFIKVDDATILSSNSVVLADGAEFVACCDGVFCIDDYVENMVYAGYCKDRRLSLWNPALRQFKILPMTVDRVLYPIAIGFGFDVTSNDYKVVKVYSMKKDPLCWNVDVYSLNTHSWRTIDSQPITISYPNYFKRAKGLIHEGCFYWTNGRSNGSYYDLDGIEGRIYLNAVQLNSNSSQEDSRGRRECFVLPDSITVRFFSGFGYLPLTVFKGCVSICGYAENYTFEVWWMVDSKRNEWNKQSVVFPIRVLSLPGPSVSVNNKIIVLECSTNIEEVPLRLYDMELKMIEEILPQGVNIDWMAHGLRYYVADNYVESLVSVIPPPNQKLKHCLKGLAKKMFGCFM